MKKMWLLIALIVFGIPVSVRANIVCNDGTVSPTCSACYPGCCSFHGGCTSEDYDYDYGYYDDDDDYSYYDDDDDVDSDDILLFTFVGFIAIALIAGWINNYNEKFKKKQELLAKQGRFGTKVQYYQCSICGAEVSEKDKKCPKCGSRFDDDDSKPDKINKEQELEENDIEYECSICGAAVSEKDKKCPKCGSKFE